MDALSGFVIAYKGLAEGTHGFDWELDDSFFAAFEGSEIRGGRVHAHMTMERRSTMLELEFALKGQGRVECDRCLEECAVPVEYEGGFVVRFGEERKDEEFDGELMWLGAGEGEFSVAQYLYESVVLSLPLSRTHADCRPQGVTFITEEEFERAERGSEMQKMADNPEWQKLQELKDKL
jgi:uncharacterized metal-binding protein YceD (DUF177 family)